MVGSCVHVSFFPLALSLSAQLEAYKRYKDTRTFSPELVYMEGSVHHCSHLGRLSTGAAAPRFLVTNVLSGLPALCV